MLSLKKATFCFMQKNNLLINFSFLFWVFALINWCFNMPYGACLLAALSLTGFITHIWKTRVNNMFKKSKVTESHQEISTTPETHRLANATNESKTISSKLDATVIATGVCIEGNIESGELIHIYGTLKGNIHTEEGIIKVAQCGRVEGNIECRTLIVDGSVDGQCSSDSLEIAENGFINGTISYQSLTIKKGGVFLGHAGCIVVDGKKGNVVGFIKEAKEISVSEKNIVLDKLPETSEPSK